MADPRKDPRRPTVQLVGEDGNAFAILSKVQRALRVAGYSKEEINSYYQEATSGNYDNLICVTAEWVNVE